VTPARHDSISSSSFPKIKAAAGAPHHPYGRDFEHSDVEPGDEDDDDDENPCGREGIQPLTTRHVVLASIVGSSHVSLGASQTFLLGCRQMF
jgi:hypothetical protein